MHLHDVAA